MAVAMIDDRKSPVLMGTADSIEPKSKSRDGRTQAQVAVDDALMVVGGAWLIAAFLYLSVRRFNI